MCGSWVVIKGSMNVYIVKDIYKAWIIPVDKRRTYFHFITKLPMVRLRAGEPIVALRIGNICQQVIVLLLILCILTLRPECFNLISDHYLKVLNFTCLTLGKWKYFRKYG